MGDYITVAPAPSVRKRLPLSPPLVFRYVNGQSAFFRGWNLGMQRIGKRLEMRFQASKTIADDRELMQPVLGIPPMEVDSAICYGNSTGRYWAEYGMRNVWIQRRVSAAQLETRLPGFTVHRLRFGATLWDRPAAVQLHVGIENLGDEYYYEHLNSPNPFTLRRIPEVGRALLVGLTTSW